MATEGGDSDRAPRLHASVFGARVLAVLLGSAASAGCADQPKTRTLAISAHRLASCPLADDELDAELSLTPLGDFAARAPSEVGVSAATDLDFPSATRAIAAELGSGDRAFAGYVERVEDDLPILLWPKAVSCRLDGAMALVPAAGRAIGYSARSRWLLLAGASDDAAPAESVGIAGFHAGTGEWRPPLGDAQHSLGEPRAFASVTDFGGALLVAGGENPLRNPGGVAVPSRSAEILDPASQRVSASISLNVERSQHSAVVLSSGETLLIGGRGPNGTALNALETISPASRSASIAGLAALRFPRLGPAVLALDDGNWLVAGGTAADGVPISAFEWLSGDAHDSLRGRVFPAVAPRYDRAFTALPGGGALVAGGCALSESGPCGAPCRLGCPPLAEGSGEERYDAWWIDPDGGAHELELDVAAPQPVLFGGASGDALLSTGDLADPRLLRFDPWSASFVPIDRASAALPRASDPRVALDAQALVWFAPDADGGLFGLRSGTRNHFAADSELISRFEESEVPAPYPLVPDRPTLGRVRYDAGARFLSFDDDSSARVFVAGADYADVTVDLWVEGDAPVLVLGSADFGGADCPWPAGATTQFRLARSGERVVLSSGALVSPACAVSGERLRLGVQRGSAGFAVRQLRIVRGGN